MGVMSCNRVDCESIMVHTHVYSVGKVCDECQYEFKEYLKKENLNPETEGQITIELLKFMNTPKDCYVEGKKVSVDEFFQSRTR